MRYDGGDTRARLTAADSPRTGTGSAAASFNDARGDVEGLRVAGSSKTEVRCRSPRCPGQRIGHEGGAVLFQRLAGLSVVSHQDKEVVLLGEPLAVRCHRCGTAWLSDAVALTDGLAELGSVVAAAAAAGVDVASVLTAARRAARAEAKAS